MLGPESVNPYLLNFIYTVMGILQYTWTTTNVCKYM